MLSFSVADAPEYFSGRGWIGLAGLGGREVHTLSTRLAAIGTREEFRGVRVFLREVASAGG
jgi:hypothetical protein